MRGRDGATHVTGVTSSAEESSSLLRGILSLSLLFCALGIAADSIDDWLLVWCVACGAHVSVRWCSGTVVWSHASAAAGSEEEVGGDDLDLTLGGVSCRGGEFTG